MPYRDRTEYLEARVAELEVENKTGLVPIHRIFPYICWVMMVVCALVLAFLVGEIIVIFALIMGALMGSFPMLQKHLEQQNK